MKPRSALSWTLAGAFALACSCLVGLCVYFTPLCGDDLFYVNANFDYVRGQSGSVDWKAMWDILVDEHLTHNGRLGDRLSVVALTLMPQWLFASVCGLFTLMLFAMIALIGKTGSRIKPLSLMASTTLTMACIPWCDYLAIGCFNINYIWDTALSLACVYLFVRADAVAARGLATKVAVGALFLFSASIHEQSSVILGTSMALIVLAGWIAARGKAANPALRWRTAMLMLWCAGSLYWLSSPSLLNRAGDFSIADILLSASSHVWALGTLVALPALLFLSIGAVLAIRAAIRRGFGRCLRIGERPRATALAMCLLVVTLNLLVFLCFTEPRILTLGVAFAIAGFISLLSPAMDRSAMLRLVAAALLAVAGFFIISVFASETLKQRRIGHEYEQIMERYAQSPDGLVVADFTQAPGLRNHPWEISYTNQWLNPFNLYLSRLYFFRDSLEHPLRLLPADPKSWNGRVFTPAEIGEMRINSLTGLGEKHLTMTSSDGSRFSANAIFAPFTPEELSRHTDLSPLPFDANSGDTLFYMIPILDSRRTSATWRPTNN